MITLDFVFCESAALSQKTKSKVILVLLALAMFGLGLRLIWMSGML